MPLYRRTPTGPWVADFYDANGKRQRVNTKTTNKTVAQKIHDRLKLESAANKFGINQGGEPSLDSLIDEFIAYLGRNGDQHKSDTAHRIKRVATAAKWTKARQITQYEVETIVQNLRNERPSKADQPLSLRSQHHYLTAMKSFTRWLTNVRRVIPTDPLVAVRKPGFQHDRKLVRRFLLHSEWDWLSQTENSLLYETAIQTGLRASELLSLKPVNVKADHIYLAGSATKNKQAARQFVSEQLAQKLKKALPFKVKEPDRMAELLRADLQSARVMAMEHGPLPADFLQPVNAEGAVLDFHALRHTCGAWLAIAGVGPKIIQSVMRHSSIALTFETYGHLMPGAEKEAAATLTAILNSSKT